MQDRSIFSSSFSLVFNNDVLESKYQSQQEQKRVTYNSYFNLFLFFLSTINNFCHIQESITWEFMGIMKLMSSLYFLVMIWVLKKSAKSEKSMMLNNVTYLVNRNLLTLVMISLRAGIKEKQQGDCTYLSLALLPPLYTFEVIVLNFMMNIGMSDFLREMKLWSLTIILVAIKLELKPLHTEMIFYLALFILVSYLNYHATCARKKCFYFKEQMKEDRVWYMNVLENINTGFIKVSNQEIIYANKAMKENFNKLKINDEEEHLTKQEIQVLKDILKSLLKNQKNHLENCPFQVLSSALTQKGSEFFFLGTKSFPIDEEEITFEISSRLVRVNNSQEVLEFLFNDITKVKYIEQKIADQKYRALIHSKIAHEFKNPLISINELVDQVADFIGEKSLFKSNNNQEMVLDNLNINNYCPTLTYEPISTRNKRSLTQKSSKRFYSACFSNKYKHKKIINHILPNIKAMSNYLLLLIKDFAYFSKNDYSNLSPDLTECSLDDMLRLCEDIAGGLLKKLGKFNNVKFKVVKEDLIPEKIVTDEIKLKQVLVNLISNSVKFTNRGKIKLDLKLGSRVGSKFSKQVIVFSVHDTGVGIPKKKNIFNDDFNSIGMTIIKNFTKILGEEIKYKSEQNKGSHFWFSIPVNTTELLNLDDEEYLLFNPFKKRKSRTEFSAENNLDGNFAESTSRQSSPNNRSFILPNSKRFSLFNTKNKEKIISYDNIDNDNSLAETVFLDNLVFTNPFHAEESEIEEEGEKFNLKFNNDYVNLFKFENLDNNYCNPDADHGNDFDPDAVNIIIADDEKFIRSSSRRLIEQIADNLNIKVNLIETEDGLETIFCVYKYISNGRKISCIFSDENMVYMKGSQSAGILHNLCKDKSLLEIPFYIITTYEDNLTLTRIKNNPILGIYPKPLAKNTAEQILSGLKRP